MHERLDVVGLELEETPVDLAGRLHVALPLELLADLRVLGDGLLGEPLLSEQLGDLEPTHRIGRVHGRHLAQQGERFVLPSLTVMAVRRRLQRADRLGGEPHPLVEIGQGLVGGRAIRIEVDDLLVDGDRAGVEALPRVLVGHLGVGVDRLVDLSPSVGRRPRSRGAASRPSDRA